MTPLDQLAELRRQIVALENQRAPIDREILKRQVAIERLCADAIAAVQPPSVLAIHLEPRSLADCVRLAIAELDQWTNREVVRRIEVMFPDWASRANPQVVSTTLHNMMLRGTLKKDGPVYRKAA